MLPSLLCIHGRHKAEFIPQHGLSGRADQLDISAEFIVIVPGDPDHADDLTPVVDGQVDADARPGVFIVRPDDETVQIFTDSPISSVMDRSDTCWIRTGYDAACLVHQVGRLADRAADLGNDHLCHILRYFHLSVHLLVPPRQAGAVPP